MTDTEALQTPTLDPRNERELVEQSLIRGFNASGGKLNDFSTSSVLRALAEGLCFSSAELLYYVNKLPLALAIAFLKNAGVERRLGTYATVNVTFTLSQPAPIPFTIPSGFQVGTAQGSTTFRTDTQLIIPAGGFSGSVSATCEQLGRSGNVAAYTITRFTQPLTNLATVINTQPATGGTDAETQESAIARGLTAIRRRNIVTADDYEQEAIAALGAGSVAKAIGLLALDKISYQLGAVHLFLLNQSGEAPNAAQLAAVQTRLTPRLQIGTALYVSPIDLLNIDVDLVAELGTGEDPNEVAERLWTALQDYLDPTKFEVGQSLILKEIEYNLRLAGGLNFIQSVTLNGQPSNLPLPNIYSLPRARSLFMQLVSSETGATSEIFISADEERD